jgi:competence ComEA-like helix-hairpin-helix protein
LAASGQQPLDLSTATEADVAARVSISADQAKVIVEYVANATAPTMGDFIRRDLNQLRQITARQQGQQATGQQRVTPLNTDELRVLIDEATIGPGADAGAGRLPGKLNINTCAAETVQYLPGMTPELADAIIAERSGKAGGFTSIVDLLEVPGMSRAQLSQLNDLLCVRSNVFSVTCRGRDDTTGLEVEIRADLDRSSLPVSLSGVMVR